MSYALITGAGKGIGRAIVFEFAKKNFNILATDISGDLLENLAREIMEHYNVQVHYITLDLSVQGNPEKLYNWCVQNEYPVSVIVNNAGFGLSGYFEQYPVEETTGLINLNIVATTQLCRLFIPLLRKQQQSYIMNICSSSAYQAVPLLTVYAASKAYILRFTRGLRHELMGSNISVTCLSPGPTDTDWVHRAKVSQNILRMAHRLNMSPASVARIAVRSMFSKRAEVITGFNNKLGAFLAWILPDNFVERKVKRFYE